MTLRASFALAVGVAVVGSACFEPLDTTREDQPGTFGHIVLDLACQRVAYLEDLNDGDGKVDVRGDEFRAMCKAYNPISAAPEDAAPPLKALQATRIDTTAAVDAIFPEDFLGDLQGFLSSNEFLSAYDDETATAAIDALIGVLRLLAEDDQAMAALERLNVRLGYKPLEPGLGVVRSVVNYPGMNDMLLTLTEAITPGGSARAEWENLVEAVGASMRDAQPADDTDASQRTIQLALNLLMSEQALLGTDRTIGLVRRDTNGLAQIQAEVTKPGDDAKVGTFADNDSDGAVDIVNGRYQFRKTLTETIDAPSPFALAPDEEETAAARDALGRALDRPGGTPLYRYVDLDKTVLTALARDGIDLFDPSKGTALDLLRGTSALMGGRIEATKTFDSGEQLAYRGYDLSQSALLDMLYGYLQVLRDPNIYYVLGLGKALIANHEPQVARLAEAVVVAARKADAHPEAVIPANKALWDDLIHGTHIKEVCPPETPRDSCPTGFRLRFVRVIPEILAKPQLVIGLMRALERPEVKGLSQHFFNYMTKKDRFPFNPSAINTPPPSAFVTPVDRAAPDSGFNRSIMQRLLHIIADSNGAQMCNRDGATLTVHVGPLPVTYPLFGGSFDKCDLIQIDNLAVFYVQSIVGKARMTFKDGVVEAVATDSLMQEESGINGFKKNPTPEALNRILALDRGTGAQSCPVKIPEFLDTVIDPVTDKDGHKYCAVHPDTLQVWEVGNFYTQIRPVVQAFADNEAEFLFVDFLTVLHKHWATEDSDNHQTQVETDANYVSGAGAMRYEALIGDMLQDGTLLGALVDASPIINNVSVNPGTGARTAPTILRDAGLYLLSAQPDLANRAGVKTSTTADGRAVAQLSPWQILADAYALKQSRMTAAGAEGTAWSESISEVIDVLVRGVEVPAGNGAPATWRFQNPRMRGVSVALIDFVESRLRYHDTVSRDRVAWLSEEMPTDLSDMLSGPVFAGAADFVLSLQASPETRQHLEGLVQYLVDEIAYDEAFVASMTSVADLAQLVLADSDMVPIARVIGDALRADRGWVEDQLTFFKRARQSDKTEALTRMMRNLYSEYKPGHTAVGDLVDGISEVMRARPYDDLGERYTAEDFRALLGGIASFLDDERRGLRKFIDIIKHRNL
jgi:hypothetical protein